MLGNNPLTADPARRRPIFVLAAVLMTFAAVAAADDTPKAVTRAEPPEAAFEVVDGWLTVRVTDAGKPFPGVKVRCLVGPTVWAEGETDGAGRGSFPRPTAEWCQVVFDLGAGPSAPVPVTFLPDGRVVPLSAAVKDGSAACCVVPSSPRGGSVPPAETPFAFNPSLLGAACAGAAFGAVLLLRRWQTRRGRPSHPPRDSRYGR